MPCKDLITYQSMVSLKTKYYTVALTVLSMYTLVYFAAFVLCTVYDTPAVCKWSSIFILIGSGITFIAGVITACRVSAKLSDISLIVVTVYYLLASLVSILCIVNKKPEVCIWSFMVMFLCSLIAVVVAIYCFPMWENYFKSEPDPEELSLLTPTSLANKLLSHNKLPLSYDSIV